jgi:hypothetical protein
MGVGALIRYLGELWAAVRAFHLSDWSNLATALGIIFVAAQVLAWKRLKIRELRANVAREVAAKVNAATDAVRAALLDPADHLSGEADTPYVALMEMGQGCAGHLPKAAELLGELRQELAVARLHFSDAELSECMVVLRFGGDVGNKINAALKEAVEHIASGESRAQFEQACAALRAEASVLREHAMDSLRDVASYERPSMPQRIWRRMRPGRPGRTSPP